MNQWISTCRGNFIPCKYLTIPRDKSNNRRVYLLFTREKQEQNTEPFSFDLEKCVFVRVRFPVGNLCLSSHMMENASFDGAIKIVEISPLAFSRPTKTRARFFSPVKPVNLSLFNSFFVCALFASNHFKVKEKRSSADK